MGRAIAVRGYPTQARRPGVVPLEGARAGVSLRAVLPDARLPGNQDIRVTSCTNDSRRVRPGDLFVAMLGVEHDGHEFAHEAIARGARAVLAERALPAWQVPVIQVGDTRQALGRLCQALAGQPSQRLKVVGVTGTNGKTTTTLLIASILEAAGHLPGVLGTLGYFDGLELEPAGLTTPTAPQLADWLARMVANGCSHAVMEVTSHALCLGRVAGVEFDAACLTNVRHDHLDFHGTFDRYRAAKGRLLRLLKPEGVAVFNVDDPGALALVRDAAGPTLTVGIDGPAEIWATPIESHWSEQTFLLHVDRAALPVRTRLIGRHNVENCLVAAAVGLSYGIDPPTVVRGLEAVARVPGRLERLTCGQPFGVFVDYAHTPDALGCVLKTLRPLVRGRLICVFGAGGDRDSSKRPAMGQAVDRGADLAVITSDNTRHESPRAIAADILSGFRVGAQPQLILDRGEAIAWALDQARPGDCVLIAGKGHESMQWKGDYAVPFDDREFATEWLYAQGTVEARSAA